jgi:hypothetical protein
MLFNNLLESLLQLAKKSQIPIDLACANFKNAIIRTFEIYDTDRKIDINIDVDKNVLDISEVYTVIPDNVDDYDDIIEMPINEAKKIVSDCKVGDTIKKTIDLNSIISDRSFYERLAKNMRLSNNIERNKKVFEKYKNEKGKIVRKRVETYQPTVGGIVEYDKDIKAEIIHDNTIPREQLIPNTEYDFYVCDVIEQPRE